MTTRDLKRIMAYETRALKIKRIDPNYMTRSEKEDSDVDGFLTLKERNRYMRAHQSEFNE